MEVENLDDLSKYSVSDISNINVSDTFKNNTMRDRIKHIVISGGCVWGFSAFGIVFEGIESGFINMDMVESLYLTSIGSVVGTMFALKINHIILREYLIQRPWEQVCKKSTSSVLEIYDNKGIVQPNFFIEFFSPLLKSVDLDVDSTMLDLYNYNGMEIHIYVTELNSFTLVDVSYKTHPEWRIVDAIHASCTIPLVFTPIIKGDQCFIDGGFFMNYPISKCLENVENNEEILGISLGNISDDSEKLSVRKESNIFDLLNVLLNRVINNIDFFSNNKQYEIPYQIHYASEAMTIDYCLQVLYSKEERHDLIYKGIAIMKENMTEWNNTESLIHC